MKTVIKAEIVAHSVNEQGDELISVMATFPRIILAEVNTHRMLSKNTSSSRAIPFKKMVESIKNDPFIPIAWQKEHKGMQGNDYFQSETGENVHKLVEGWLDARNSAVQIATGLNNSNVTKQLCNRLLEPFMWTTMLITGPRSGWDNFFNLRCPQYQMTNFISTGGNFYGTDAPLPKGDFKHSYLKSRKDVLNSDEGSHAWAYKTLSEIDWFKVNKGQAEIHMMALAECIWDAYNESTPKQLKAGEWHIPFEGKIGRFANIPLDSEVTNPMIETNILHNKIFTSVAMAARTSYTVVGEEKGLDYEALIGLHDRLIAQDPPHSSPLEHCARAMSDEEHGSYIKGKIDLIDIDEPEYNGGIYEPQFSEKGWCNNFKGFIPYRYLVDNRVSI